MYGSFGQLLPFFHLEESWIPLLAIRTDTVAGISGGISQVIASALELFVGALPSNIAIGGCVLLAADGRQTRIFAGLWMLLMDGGAHKLLWHCKGDAGTKLCMLCPDLLAEDTG